MQNEVLWLLELSGLLFRSYLLLKKFIGIRVGGKDEDAGV